MKRCMLILCAVACTVYGEESMEEADMQIMQNSTVIPKDSFEMMPLISDMVPNDMEQTDMVMEQTDSVMEQNQEDMEQNQEPEEAGGAVSKLGFDFKPWSKNDKIPTLGQLNTLDLLGKNTKLTKHDDKKSATTTTTAATLFDLNNQTRHHKTGNKHAKKEREETCQQVAVKVPSTCYKDETLEIPYHCHKDVVKQECKMVAIDVPSTCQKTEYVQEQYPCQKTRSVCRDVTKPCERIEYKEEEYVCGAPVCKPVKKQVPSTCTRKTKVKLPVPCPPPKKCKKIKMIDQSYPCGTRNVCKDVLNTDAVCQRDVQVEEDYECLKQPQTQANKAFSFKGFHKERGTNDAVHPTEEDDSDVTRKEGCSQVTIQVPSECTKSVVEKKPYACVKTEEKQVCKNVTVRVPGVCTKSVQVDELYDCIEPNNMEASMESGRVCQEGSASDETDTSDNMRKNRQLKHAKKCKKSCKVRKVTKEEPYKCEKTQVVKECSLVPTQIHSTCYEEQTVEKQYACRIPKTVERCERMYTRCKRAKTIQEPYKCEKKERKCEAVPQTCHKKVPVEYEEVCDLKHSEGDAQKKSKAPQVCTETVERDEEYACKKTIQVEECGKERVCKRRVAFPVMDECTENVCADIMERQSCSRTVPVVKDYDCTKQDHVEQCEDKTHKVLSTCIKTITKPKPYMCSETQYQTICTSHKK